MKTYDVKRQHFGDKMYMPGDQRQANPGEVAHLVNNGVLAAAKASPKIANKADPKASNKGA